jgi:nuclear transcription Y subunit beta
MKERRKTINGDDIIWSLGTLGFEEYVEPLKIYLKNYREVSFNSNLPLSSSSCYWVFIIIVFKREGTICGV